MNEVDGYEHLPEWKHRGKDSMGHMFSSRSKPEVDLYQFALSWELFIVGRICEKDIPELRARAMLMTPPEEVRGRYA